MKVISIVNNKGGVGKTTTTQNLGVALSKFGKKVAIVDFDPQANLSFSIKHKPNLDLGALLRNRQPVSIREFSETEYENLYLLPNKKDINSGLFNAFKTGDQMFAFKDVISELQDFDIMLVDTAPELEIPTFNTLVASDYVLIPVEYEIFSAMGVQALIENIESIRRINTELELLGIVATKVFEGRKLNKEMEKPLRDAFGNKVFNTYIRTNEKFKQAQAENTDIFTYEGDSHIVGKGSEDFRNLATELLTRIS